MAAYVKTPPITIRLHTVCLVVNVGSKLRTIFDVLVQNYAQIAMYEYCKLLGKDVEVEM